MPGMRHELQECYINCEQCSRYSARNSKETLITRPVPEYPFQRIGLDTMTLDGRKYLVCVDYFSNYTLVDRLQGTSSCCTIKLIKKHFMRYGIPEEVVSDGGPEFDNKMMRELTHKYGFRWNPCSPEMPNSYGMAESAVKQIKCIIKKCNNENSNPCLALLEFTNTPSKSIGMSPAQRFFGRQLRNVLPTMKKFLSPFNVEETKTKIQKAKQHQKKYYDKNAHDLIELREGDQVTVQPYGKNQYWKMAVVTEKFEYRRYMVELENGKSLVRNRRHLRLTTKPKHSNMTKTNHKQDITSNDSEQNTKK